MSKYILMNQNSKVLKLKFDEELNVITKIEEIYNIKFAPLEIKNSLKEKQIIEINNWFC